MAKAQKLPSGNYRVRVTDPETGKRQSFTAPTKREAELAALEWLGGKKVNADSRTVGECIDDYINSKVNILSPTTIDGYRKCRRNCLSELCPLPVSKLTQLDVQKHMNMLALTYSPKTVRNAHGLLVSVLNTYSPGTFLHTTLPKMQKKIKQLPPAEQVVAAVIGSEIELPCMLALWEGMRMSEIRGAKRSDLNGNILTIHETVVTVEGQNITKDSTKTFDSTRQISLSPYIMELISRLPEEQEHFTVLSGQAIYKRFSRLLQSNGIAHMTFHDLRHMNASTMLMLGIPDKYAMERGGWSSPHIMKSVYQHTFSSERKLVDNAVDEFFMNIIDKTDTKTDTNSNE